jgi:hypothetical protein
MPAAGALPCRLGVNAKLLCVFNWHTFHKRIQKITDERQSYPTGSVGITPNGTSEKWYLVPFASLDYNRYLGGTAFP